MYTFPDKKGRDLCLIPEATAIVAETYRGQGLTRVFYAAKCYRYERPQAGRYREFTQFGVELLGGSAPDDWFEMCDILNGCLATLQLQHYTWDSHVRRGLAYYVEDGFEIRVDRLGAQKQVCGGGRYDGGIGFAFGVDRLLLCE